MKFSTTLAAICAVSVTLLSPMTHAQSTPRPAAAPAQQAAAPAVQPVPLQVFVTSTTAVKDWVPVKVGQDTYYLEPTPRLTSADLTGVDPRANDQGQGFVALTFNDAGKAKLLKMSRDAAGKRVAVTFGDQIVALPQIQDPLTEGFMMFGVVSPQAAQIIAYGVAGIPLPQQAQPQAQPAPAQPRK